MKYIVLCLLVLGLVAYATNPAEERFREYLHHRIVEYAQNQPDSLSNKIIPLFAGPAADLVPVQHRDYLLFTVFREEATPQQGCYLGLFNHFFQLRDNLPLKDGLCPLPDPGHNP